MRKGFAAIQARMIEPSGLPEAVAFGGAKVSDRSATLLSGKLYSALTAIVGEGHGNELRFCKDYEHGHASFVHNLSVAQTPEFFANGVLVHNCDLCIQNGEDGPIDIDELFSGTLDLAPPGHPRCRCVMASQIEE